MTGWTFDEVLDLTFQEALVLCGVNPALRTVKERPMMGRRF